MPKFNSNPMGKDTRRAVYRPGETLELLPLAAARPAEALAKARAVLALHPGPYDASVAHQAVGIVLRDFGDARAAIRELRAALRMATAAGSRDRHADVLATLGTALVYAGRTTPGLTALDTAVKEANGTLAGRVLMRRAFALWRLGRHHEALADLRRAVMVLHRSGDTMWEARALSARAFVHLAVGSAERADTDLGNAERLFAATSQELEQAFATHNRGLVAFRSGDLTLALSHFDQAARRCQVHGAPIPDLSIDRCAVLLAAGLPRDALDEADAAIRDLDQVHGQATKKAELLLTAARAALADADAQAAQQRAQAARRLFGSQQRTWWHAQAGLLLLQARYSAGSVSGRLLREAERTAVRLDALGSADAQHARLLAGRVALALGRPQDADRNLAAAARGRRRPGPAMTRANAWLAEALRAAAAGRPRRLLSACRHGLSVLDEHQLTLGASELRARATAQGAELAVLAQRHALDARRPRALLFWTERWRATALAVPPVRPFDDQQLQADLTAVRDVMSRLEVAGATGAPTAELQREQLRLESAIRFRAMRARGPGGAGSFGFDPATLLEKIAAERLIQIADIGGILHVLVCGAGRVRHFTAAAAAEASREVDFARFGLNRLAHNRPAGQQEHALAMLEATGRRLEDRLLGQANRHLGDGAVVIVPPGSFHAVPWALLPSLRDRVLSVAPSARAWLRAQAAIPPAKDDLVLVRGPGLGTGGGEVPVLAEESAGRYDKVTVLGDGTATAKGVLDAIDGARLAHIAAHGTFRSDNPLFSSLRMDDGPLTVHDFERLRRAPYRLILPSCDSAVLAPAGADELLGLTSTLVPLGTAGIIASVAPVNDFATAALMLALHRKLRRGATLAESLRDARHDLDDHPAHTATGWSFIALGAR
jgi:tetratricopeptide (TPR) repeat protein